MDTKWKFILAATAVLGSAAVYYQMTKQPPQPRKSSTKRKKTKKVEVAVEKVEEKVAEDSQATIIDIPTDVL